MDVIITHNTLFTSLTDQLQWIQVLSECGDHALVQFRDRERHNHNTSTIRVTFKGVFSQKSRKNPRLYKPDIKYEPHDVSGNCIFLPPTSHYCLNTDIKPLRGRGALGRAPDCLASRAHR